MATPRSWLGVSLFFILIGGFTATLLSGEQNTFERFYRQELTRYVQTKQQELQDETKRLESLRSYFQQMLQNLDQAGQKAFSQDIARWEKCSKDTAKALRDAETAIRKGDIGNTELALIAAAKYRAEQQKLYELMDSHTDLLIQQMSFNENMPVFEDKDASAPLKQMGDATKKRLQILADIYKRSLDALKVEIEIAGAKETAELLQVAFQASATWQSENIDEQTKLATAQAEKLARDAQELATNQPMPQNTTQSVATDAIGHLEIRPDGSFRLNGAAVNSNELTRRLRTLVGNNKKGILEITLTIDPKSQEAEKMIKPIGAAAKEAGVTGLRVFGPSVEEQSIN